MEILKQIKIKDFVWWNHIIEKELKQFKFVYLFRI